MNKDYTLVWRKLELEKMHIGLFSTKLQNLPRTCLIPLHLQHYSVIPALLYARMQPNSGSFQSHLLEASLTGVATTETAGGTLRSNKKKKKRRQGVSSESFCHLTLPVIVHFIFYLKYTNLFGPPPPCLPRGLLLVTWTLCRVNVHPSSNT